MPLALIVIGVIFLTAAIRGTHMDLFAVLKDDFTGPNNFLMWGLAFFVIGSVGYIKALKPISNSFLVLVFLVLFISNRGFFNKFVSEIRGEKNVQDTIRNVLNI